MTTENISYYQVTITDTENLVQVRFCNLLIHMKCYKRRSSAMACFLSIVDEIKSAVDSKRLWTCKGLKGKTFLLIPTDKIHKPKYVCGYGEKTAYAFGCLLYPEMKFDQNVWLCS